MAEGTNDDPELGGLDLVVPVAVVEREGLSDLLTLLGGELLNI